jgi:hypothetical protein
MQGPSGAFNLFQDVGSAGRPDEGFGIFVVTVDVTADRQDEFFEIAKYTAPQSVLSEVAEEALHHVEPRRTGRSEVHVEPWMASKPTLNLGMLVGCVVVADQV